MTDNTAPNPDTFDLIGAIEGIVRPEETVNFLFDEKAAQTVNNIENELKRLAMLGKTEEYDNLDKVKNNLIEGLKDSIYKVTVRAIPREVKKAIIEKAEAKHPDQSTPLGVPVPNHAGVEYLNLLKWQAMIVGFEAPNGAKANIPLSDADIEHLVNRGPEASLRALGEAVDELETGARSGYEQVVQGLNFLSERSPEA